MRKHSVCGEVVCCALLPCLVAASTDRYTFRTFDYPGSFFTAGFTITPSGEIGGYACTETSCQGFVRPNAGDPSFIVPPGAIDSFVTGIQRGGFLLAGQYTDAAGTAHGYVWNLSMPSEFTTVDPPGSVYTEVADMNPAGDLAGRYQDDLNGPTHGFVKREGVITPFDIPGAGWTAAYGINAPGDVVGTYCDVERCHAFLLRGGIAGVLTTIDMPDAVSTDAFGANAIGQVVGNYCLPDGTCHGYVWSPAGRFTTIDPPGSTFTIAFAIDPAGQITGMFCDETACHAFIATPTNASELRATGPTPAPAGGISHPSRHLHRFGKGEASRVLVQR